jgi:adenylate cyclase
VAEERVERRLAAILAADVAGYSRMMGADEIGTLAALKAHRRELIDPKIAEHRGRIVKTSGDSLLVEFASVVDAVRCAVEVNEAMAKRNADVPEEERIEFRVGINVGDIIIDEGDILGDGVNIAARLEGIAQPGSIILSKAARDQVHDKVDVTFDDMGEQTLKNIARPVHVYRVATGSSPTGGAMRPTLALPDKPSIAVLPFQNMSGDPEQDYFADGIVEDMITALSRIGWLFVIARNSSFTYKGKPVDVKQVGRELGVRYVLQGSVRKAGNRVRITGQLIDAVTGAHLWADKFDGAMEGVFELQDTVTEHVVASIEPSVRQAEINRARAKPTSNLDAYDCYLRALPPYYLLTREGTEAAVVYLRQAIELDPGYALAKAFLAFNYTTRRLQGLGAPNDRANAYALAQEAIADDPNDPSTLRWAGHALGFWGDYDRALAVLDSAARLNVNGSQTLNSLGWVRCYACLEPDTAIAHFERATRLSPRDPEICQMLTGIAFAHLIAGRNEEALVFARRSVNEAPRFTSGHRAKIVALESLGRCEEAKAAADVLLAYDPGFTITSRLPVYRDAQFRQKYYGGLKAAGLPE